jgi:8-oxo-dGTP pyrophosphatase MutT (NUDIX family)
MLARYAFAELGLQRVEAYVDRENRASLRTAMRAGLRREGVLRGHGAVEGRRRDVIIVGRLADDPEPTTPEGFRGLLNAGLNRTRVIAQALIRDEAGRVLLCELTYKRFWDLPGGVVDPFESPAEAVAREVGEEVGVDLAVGALKVVSWLPPWQGWDDACLFVFEASVPAGSFDGARLEEREIAALHWCGLDDLDTHVADYTARLIRAAVDTERALYLEDGLPRE